MNRDDLPLPPAEVPPEAHSGFMARFRNYFLTGLIVAGPIAITFYLTWWFVTWVDDLVRPFIPIAYRPETYLPGKIPGTGLIVAVFALTMLGFLTANILDRMPLVRSIYKGLKQVFETLFSQSGSSFRTVGLVEFPAPGMWSLVFLSQRPGAEITSHLPSREEYVSVFLPCTPNPTTGFFFYVARSAVIELDIPVEAAAKLIMSAGLIQPGNGDSAKKLSTLAEAARVARAARIEPAEGRAGAGE